MQQLSTVAAVSVLTVLPYSAIFLLQTDKALAEIESNGEEALKGKEEDALEKVRSWKTHHTVRIVLGAVGWVAGILALESL